MSDKWDRRYLELAKHISTWSKDPSTQVGAVIVSNNKIVATGFNGFPRDVDDDPERYKNRELKNKLIVHAEINAILQAGHECSYAHIYVSVPFCCSECTKAIIQSGISRIVAYDNADKELLKRWEESIKLSQLMLDESGIEFHVVQENYVTLQIT